MTLLLNMQYFTHLELLEDMKAMSISYFFVLSYLSDMNAALNGRKICSKYLLFQGSLYNCTVVN